MEQMFYVLDQYKHILCTCSETEAKLEQLAGMPPGYEIVDEDDKPVDLIH